MRTAQLSWKTEGKPTLWLRLKPECLQMERHTDALDGRPATRTAAATVNELQRQDKGSCLRGGQHPPCDEM